MRLKENSFADALTVNFTQIVHAYAGVNLRRTYMGMTEYFLHITDTGAVSYHRCRHGMTENMANTLFIYAGFFLVLPDAGIHRTRSKSVAADIQK